MQKVREKRNEQGATTSMRRNATKHTTVAHIFFFIFLLASTIFFKFRLNEECAYARNKNKLMSGVSHAREMADSRCA